MTDTTLAVVIKADASGLVGQVGAAETKLRTMTGALDGVSSSAKNVTSTAGATAGAQGRLASASGEAGSALMGQAAAADIAATADKRLATAAAASTSAMASKRAGAQQIGFQLQDFAVQVGGGTSAIVAFSQQAPQMIGALQMMGNGAEGATGKAAKFISLIGGPWGIALGVAIPVVGALASALFGSGDAADKATKSTFDFTNVLDTRMLSVSRFTDAVMQLNSETKNLIKTQALMIDSTLANAKAQEDEANRRLDAIDKRMAAIRATGDLDDGPVATLFGNPFTAGREAQNRAEYRGLQDERKKIESNRETAEASRITAELALSQRRVNEELDKSAGLQGEYNRKVEELTELRRKSAQFEGGSGVPLGEFEESGEKITQTEYERRLRLLRREYDASVESLRAADRKPRRAPDRDDTNLSEATGERLLGAAKSYSGLSETSASGNAQLRELFKAANINIDPKMTAWCAAFVNAVLASQGVSTVSGNKLGAREFLDYGRSADNNPQKGDIVVLKRGDNQAQGHVGFYDGEGNKPGTIRVTGGNQTNGKVSTAQFSTKDVLGIRRAPSFAEGLEDAKKEAEALVAIGDKAAASIDQINDRWSEQPKLVTQAANETSKLDDIISDLRTKQPPGFESMIKSAEAAKVAIGEGLQRPFRELVESHQREREIQLLILNGREDEVRVMEIMTGLQAEMGDKAEDYRAEVEKLVDAETRVNELLDKRDEIIGAYQQSIGGLRGALEDLFSGGSFKDFGKSLKENAKQLRGQLMVEQMFGSGLRDLEKKVRSSTGVDAAVEALNGDANSLAEASKRATQPINDLAKAVVAAASTIQAVAQGKPLPAAAAVALGVGSSVTDAPGDGDIVVTADPDKAGGADSNAKPTLSSMSPDEYWTRAARVITGPLTEWLKRLDEQLGTKLAGKLGGVIEGGIAGYLEMGPVGGIVGAIKGLDLGGKAGDAANAAFSGAQTGTQVAQIGKMLGLGGSTTGAQIGGAIGSAIPIPGGEIIGSIIGSVVGGMFKKAKYGTAVLSNVNDDVSATGRGGAQIDAANSLGGAVQSGLQQIADTLGGQLGAFNVSIGMYKDNYRISTTGYNGKLKNGRSGVQDFGDDADAAIRAAILDAISDGGITGLSEAVQRALRSSKDVDKALREALKVREVEDMLGGLGKAMERQFREFEKQAAERVRIATQYGFDVVKIEERNAEDRLKLVAELISSRVGSLQQLLKDVSYGDLFEGSAADRRSQLQSEIAKARADADQGVDGAADRLADLSRRLIETSRDAYGTAGPEYAADRDASIRAAEAVIASENERIRAAQQAATDTAAGIATSNQLLNETNDILASIRTRLEGGAGGGGRAINIDNLLTGFDTSRSVMPVVL